MRILKIILLPNYYNKFRQVDQILVQICQKKLLNDHYRPQDLKILMAIG